MPAPTFNQKENQMTNATNNTADQIKAAIIGAGADYGKVEKAHAAFVARLQTLHDLGVTAQDLKKGGAHFATAQAELANARLNETELAAFTSDEPMKAGDAKHKAANKVNSLIRNIRENLAKLEKMPTGSDAATGEASEGAGSNGAGAKVRDINVRICDEMAKLVNAIIKDKDAEAPALKADHTEVLAAFKRINDLVK